MKAIEELKEVTYIGKPGNICIVLNSHKDYAGLPTRGIAWGPFAKDGTFKVIVDPERDPVLIMIEKDPTEEVIRHLEENWEINTE